MSEDYCELTDMVAAFCAHCLGHELEDNEDEAEAESPWFASQWPGTCTTCLTPFERTTTIRRHDRGWQADCCRQ